MGGSSRRLAQQIARRRKAATLATDSGYASEIRRAIRGSELSRVRVRLKTCTSLCTATRVQKRARAHPPTNPPTYSHALSPHHTLPGLRRDGPRTHQAPKTRCRAAMRPEIDLQLLVAVGRIHAASIPTNGSPYPEICILGSNSQGARERDRYLPAATQRWPLAL